MRSPGFSAKLAKIPARLAASRKSGAFVGDYLVPIIFIVMALLTIAMICFAGGILLGIVSYE